MSVFIRWNEVPSVRNELAAVTARRSAPPSRVQHANAAEAGGWFWWHYSTRWFSLHAQTGARFTLGWVFIALTPPPQPATPHHCMSPSIVQRYDLKWHNDPRRPVRSSPARRVATLSSGSEHPAKQLKSQNTSGGVWRTHFTVCVLNRMWLVGSTQRK